MKRFALLLGLAASLAARAVAAPVGGFLYTHVSSDTLGLQWDAQPGNSYVSVLSTVPGFAINLTSAVSPLDQNATAFYSLTPNTSHTFLVKVATDNDTNYTALSTFTLARFPASFQTPAGPDVSTFTISVTWGANGNPLTPATSYQLQISTDINFGASSSSETFLTTASSGSLTPNTSYYFRAAAFHRTGGLSAFNAVMATFTAAAAPQPAAFTVPDIGFSSLTFRWSANNNPSGTLYEAHISTDPDFSVYSSSQTVGAVSVTSNTLALNTVYYYRVRAQNQNNLWSSFSTSGSTSTLAVCPGFSGYTINDHNVTVTLLGNGNPVNTVYRVQISSDGFQTVNFFAQGASTILNVSGLQSNTTYQVSIAAVSFGGTPSSSTVIATTGTYASVPGSFITFSGANVGVNSILGLWTANSNPVTPPTSYQILISTDIAFGVYTASETFVMSVTTSGLTPNTSYYFKASAFNRLGGQSAFNTSIATFTLAATPTALISSTQSVSQITLSWQSSNPSYTRIEVSSSTDNFSSQIAVVIPFSAGFTGGTTTFTGLRESTSYFFRLRAITQNGLETTYSVVLNTRTLTINPSQVVGLIADQGGTASGVDGRVRLRWTAPADNAGTVDETRASRYLVRYATFDVTTTLFDSPLVSTFTQYWIPATQNTSEEQPVTGLNPGSTYYFAIKSLDAVSNIGAWNEASHANRTNWAVDQTPGPPSAATFSTVLSSFVTLSWTPPSAPSEIDDRDLYRAYWSTSSFSSASDPFVFQTTQAAHPSALVSVTGLANQSTYYFRITAVDKGDQGSGLFSQALESGFSNLITTVTKDLIAPAAVTNFSAVTGSTEGTITLTWTAPGDDGTLSIFNGGSLFDTRYAASLAASPAANDANFNSASSVLSLSPVPLPFLPQQSHSVIVTGLTPGVTYFFALKTRDEAGNTAALSGGGTAYAQMDLVPPAELTTLTATPGWRRIQLSWTSPGDDGLTGNVTGQFVLKYSTNQIINLTQFNASTNSITIATTTAPGSTHGTLLTGLVNGVTYYFALRVFDDRGNGSSVSTGTFTFPFNTLPGAFSLTSPSDLQIVGTSTPTLVWSASSDSDSALSLDRDTLTYTVRYSTSAAFTVGVTTTLVNITSASIVTTALQEDSTVYWDISVADLDGVARAASNNPFRVLINAFNTAPSTPILTSPSSGTIATTRTPTFQWTQSTDPDPGTQVLYDISITTLGGFGVSVTSQNIPVNSITLPTALQLTENASYYWQVTAKDGLAQVASTGAFILKINATPEPPVAFGLTSPGESILNSGNNVRLTSTSITLSWQTTVEPDPEQTFTYQVSYSTRSDFLIQTQISGLTQNSTSLILNDNTAYFWKVAAIGSDSQTRNSADTFKFYIDIAKQLPNAFDIVSPTNTSIVGTQTPTFEWQASTDTDPVDQVYYFLQLSQTPNFASVSLFDPGISTQFTIPTLAALQDQTTYYWRVLARGRVQQTSSIVEVDSNVGTGFTQSVSTGQFVVSVTNTPPLTFDLYSPVGATVTTRTPTFSWGAATDLDFGAVIRYRLVISSMPGFVPNEVVINDISPSSPTVTFTLPSTSPVLQNRLHYWNVTVIDNRQAETLSRGTNTFFVPVLAIPKEPTGITGQLSADGNTFTVGWTAVTQNTDGSALDDLFNYHVYRSTSLTSLGSDLPYIRISSSVTGFTVNPVAGQSFYYVVRAINTSGTESANSGVVQSSPDGSLTVVPNQSDLDATDISLVIPQDVKDVLGKSGNPYGEDLRILLKRKAATDLNLKKALIGIEVQVRTALSNKEAGGFTFNKPIRVTFPYQKITGAPAFGAPASAPGIAAEELAVFWRNGVEWINLGGSLNPASGNISIQTRNVGTFAVRPVAKTTEFSIMAVTPSRTFTPNGDGCNDLITFSYDNPRGLSGIAGKIFDLEGAFVAELKPGTSIGSFTFSAACPQPNLGVDTLVWDGKDANGKWARKGIYVYQIDAEGKAINGTVVVVK